MGTSSSTLGPPVLLLGALASGIGCTGSSTAITDTAETPSGSRFAVRHYAAPRHDGDGSGDGGLPLALAVDPSGNVWVLGEFHTDLHRVDASGSKDTTERITIPQHEEARPFIDRHGAPSQKSTLGEGILVDDRGRVWLSQGGGHLVRRGDNHSRVLSYDPGRDRFAAYNLPGNRNEAMGLLWDANRGLIWVAESGLYAERSDDAVDAGAGDVRPGSLLAFDPDSAPFDNRFLWREPLQAHLCARPTTSPAGCFARFELPESALGPAQLAIDGSGAIWFTLFWGDAIGRLDPATATTTLYPLAPGLGTDRRAKAVGPGPWDIALSPDGQEVVWSEFFDATIARFPIARAFDVACQRLWGGRNPCIEEVRVPDRGVERRVHSIAFDRFHNVWFTEFTFPVTKEARNSIGFVSADHGRVVLLDPTELRAGPASYAGIDIHPESGDIWLADFLPPGITRVMPANRDANPASW